MSEECCPAEEGKKSNNPITCPRCNNEGRSVSHETMYHQLEPCDARNVSPDQAHGICQTQSCSVLYFSVNHDRIWETGDVRTTVGFKQPENESSHPVCYCFGYTEENIGKEIEATGESTAVEWITERVQAGECACQYKNPSGRCCLKAVKKCVEDFSP